MVEPDDLLSKADALMARHRQPRTAADSYAEIPVLDEVVDPPGASDELSVLTELFERAPLDEERTEALAASIRASLLAALQPEIDSLIEERLKEGLAPLHEKLFGDLQLVARATLSDAINTAVAEELERRKSGD
jgi:uncharacterized protein YicC (UPF0701 family)